jgi:CRISPR-associated protein Cmr2
MYNPSKSVTVAIAWCLAWGEERQPQFDLSVLQGMRQALLNGKDVPEETMALVAQVKKLQDIPENYFPDKLEKLQHDYPELGQKKIKIGLVYGGATKIKQYVFEAAKLPDIRGASALLDRINLVDLPAFFKAEESPRFPQCQRVQDYCCQVRQELAQSQTEYTHLWDALIPELIIYSTGGNILAFCPAAFIDDLANAIERRYTEETLTANSCAVGDTFRLLELRFGLLKDPIENTFWLEKYLKNAHNPIVVACFGSAKNKDKTELTENFRNRKSFNELTTKLASMFNSRRSGNDTNKRPSRCYPPMFETHPYLIRDESDRRSAVFQAKSDSKEPAKGLPGDPWFSEPLARKRLVGQITKRYEELKQWYEDSGLTWKPGEGIDSWVYKFSKFAKKTDYYGNLKAENVKESRSLREIGEASNPKGFVAYIYADGNNMGGYIQKIKTPQEYRQFSKDIFDATEQSVYQALAKHLKPYQYKPDAQSSRQNKDEVLIHPFEILTIGGDDVMLIVPANKALEIAKTIGEEFEKYLSEIEEYKIAPRCFYHRYYPAKAKGNVEANVCSPLPNDKFSQESRCKLSMSTGVLIAAENTPVYYAEKLTSQLLKSAKKRAKDLKEAGYYGGTVDFLALKSVTMISSNIEAFRQEALHKQIGKGPKLKLYAAPYTLHELGGLIKTVRALKEAEFPKSQLYQIRSFLQQGKQTAILNYRYFRVRLKEGKSDDLKGKFEEAWCEPKDKNNKGNLAPWMYDPKDKVYETIWREMVELYEFIEPENKQQGSTRTEPELEGVNS